MRKQSVVLLLALLAVAGACSPRNSGVAGTEEKTEGQGNMVAVTGGAFIHTKSEFYSKKAAVSDFLIGKYEVTQKEWLEHMESNPSLFAGEDRPVESVKWYDAVEYCNRRSAAEGLELYYTMDKQTKDPDNASELDTLKWTVTVNPGANGYRLPTEAEWEYAAGGGQKSKSFTYSGSNEADEVSWYWRNAGEHILSGEWNWDVIEGNHDQTQPVGGKLPNELGLYDMSGNVREWCWDWYTGEDSAGGTYRVVKGGGWVGDLGSHTTVFRGKFEANGVGADQGFRVVRDN